MGWLIAMGTLGMNVSPGLAQRFLLERNPAMHGAVCMQMCVYVHVFMGMCVSLSRCCATSRQETSRHSELWWCDRKLTVISFVNLMILLRVCVFVCARMCLCVWSPSEHLWAERHSSLLFASLSSSLSLLPGCRSMCECVCLHVCVCTVCVVHCEFPESPIDKAWCDSTPLISLLSQTSDQCCCLLAMVN